MVQGLTSGTHTSSPAAAARDTPTIKLKNYIHPPPSSEPEGDQRPPSDTIARTRPTLPAYMSGLYLLPGNAAERSLLVPAWLPDCRLCDAASAKFCETLHGFRVQGGRGRGVFGVGFGQTFNFRSTCVELRDVGAVEAWLQGIVIGQ